MFIGYINLFLLATLTLMYGYSNQSDIAKFDFGNLYKFMASYTSVLPQFKFLKT